MQGIMVRRQLQNKQKEMFNLMVEQQQRQVQCLEIMKLHHLQSRLHQDGSTGSQLISTGSPPPMLRKEEGIKSPGGIASKPDGAMSKGVSFSGFENKGVSGTPSWKEEGIKSPGGTASKPDRAVGKGVSFSGFENKDFSSSGSPIRLNESNCFDDNVVDLSVNKNVEVVHESDEKLPENTESEEELSIET